MKSRRSPGAPAQGTANKHARSVPYRQLSLKVKAAIASEQGRAPRPITLPHVAWMSRPVLR
jgi:hypothetical protein